MHDTYLSHTHTETHIQKKQTYTFKRWEENKKYVRDMGGGREGRKGVLKGMRVCVCVFSV